MVEEGKSRGMEKRVGHPLDGNVAVKKGSRDEAAGMESTRPLRHARHASQDTSPLGAGEEQVPSLTLRIQKEGTLTMKT